MMPGIWQVDFAAIALPTFHLKITKYCVMDGMEDIRDADCATMPIQGCCIN